MKKPIKIEKVCIEEKDYNSFTPRPGWVLIKKVKEKENDGNGKLFIPNSLNGSLMYGKVLALGGNTEWLKDAAVVSVLASSCMPININADNATKDLFLVFEENILGTYGG